MDRSPVPWEPSRRAGESRNGNLIHIKPSIYVTSSTWVIKCLRPDCKYRYGESLRRFLPEEATQPPSAPARIWKSKTFERNRTASCCVYVRFADGGGTASASGRGTFGRGTFETRRGPRGVIRHRAVAFPRYPDFHRLGCNSLLRSPIDSPRRTRNSMLPALARSGRKSTARFRPPLHPGAKRLLLFRSSSIARGPRRAREPPRFIDSRRPLTDCQPIPNGEI
jgi:hypothetical protein